MDDFNNINRIKDMCLENIKKEKITYRAICTWGDGPDVLLVIKEDGKQKFFDLTCSQAKLLAYELLEASSHAEDMNREWFRYMRLDYCRNCEFLLKPEDSEENDWTCNEDSNISIFELERCPLIEQGEMYEFI